MVLPWKEKPEVLPDLLPVWAAFWWLHEERRFDGFAGPQRIRTSEIVTYLDEFRITGSVDRLEWIYLIRALDRRWCEWMREEREEKEGKNEQNGKGRERRDRSLQG